MFEKLRDRTGKQLIKKYQVPFDVLDFNQGLPQMPNEVIPGVYKSQVTGELVGQASFGRKKKETAEELLARIEAESDAMEEADNQADLEALSEKSSVNDILETVEKGDQIAQATETQKVGFKDKFNSMMSAKATPGQNFAAGVVSAGINAADQLLLGDKNFGAQSEAIDAGVHAVSGALMKSGNPYAMAAGAALEGANFLTKAGGQTVQGFDVDINSSGYGNIGHMESSSSRDFGAMIGLGGLNGKRMQDKLAKRNQQALMAMNAANIAEEQSFEQEARANSIQNTIMNNNIALAGGLDTSLLGG